MATTDPLSDMLTRIRNAQMRKHPRVICPASSLRGNVLDVLREEGFIRGYTRVEQHKGLDDFEIELKYHEGSPAIQEMKRVSTPGRRVYKGVDELPKVRNGLGITIVSTSKGVMSDTRAREENVGGEVLCTVF